MLFGLHLGDLASIQLNDGARLKFSPLVPEVSHTYFVAQNTDSGGVTINLSCGHDWELLVNFILEGAPGGRVVSHSEFARIRNFIVV